MMSNRVRRRVQRYSVREPRHVAQKADVHAIPAAVGCWLASNVIIAASTSIMRPTMMRLFHLSEISEASATGRDGREISCWVLRTKIARVEIELHILDCWRIRRVE